MCSNRRGGSRGACSRRRTRPRKARNTLASALRKLMCPALAAAELEVVGVGFADRLAGLGVADAINDTVALSVGDRLFLGVELEFDLAPHIGRAGPPHQRIDLAPRLSFILENPI